jgi:hypothetical protein
MDKARRRISLVLCLSLAVILAIAGSAAAKIPGGYRDIKLGMDKTQVLDLLEKSRNHFSYDDAGQEIREIVREDDLFRYATYVFNAEGVLVEIGLQMREILGRDRVLEIYNNQHGLKVSPLQRTEEANMSIEVRENTLVMKSVPPNEKRAAQRPR